MLQLLRFCVNTFYLRVLDVECIHVNVYKCTNVTSESLTVLVLLTIWRRRHHIYCNIVCVGSSIFFYIYRFPRFTYYDGNNLYRVIQILRKAMYGCRLRPWLAGQPPNGASYCHRFQTLTLFSVQFPSNWSCASMYISKAETLAFSDCDYFQTLVL